MYNLKSSIQKKLIGEKKSIHYKARMEEKTYRNRTMKSIK